VKMESEIVDNQLRTPTKIPEKIAMIKEEEAPPQVSSGVAGVIGGVAGGVAGGQLGGVIGGIISSTPVAVPKAPPPPPPSKIRVSSGVAAGLLEHEVHPVYPQIAKAARVSG